LPIADLPQAWRDSYQKNVGVTPEKDADGVMQDVHWGAGLVGYFPTYALGNLYAAQFFRQAQQDLGDLDEVFRAGEFRILLSWLSENIYQHGQRYTAAHLADRITGNPLSHTAWQEHMVGKYGQIYGF
jgi:carboxypeptidase Taq